MNQWIFKHFLKSKWKEKLLISRWLFHAKVTNTFVWCAEKQINGTKRSSITGFKLYFLSYLLLLLCIIANCFHRKRCNKQGMRFDEDDYKSKLATSKIRLNTFISLPVLFLSFFTCVTSSLTNPIYFNASQELTTRKGFSYKMSELRSKWHSFWKKHVSLSAAMFTFIL